MGKAQAMEPTNGPTAPNIVHPSFVQKHKNHLQQINTTHCNCTTCPPGTTMKRHLASLAILKEIELFPIQEKKDNDTMGL